MCHLPLGQSDDHFMALCEFRVDLVISDGPLRESQRSLVPLLPLGEPEGPLGEVQQVGRDVEAAARHPRGRVPLGQPQHPSLQWGVQHDSAFVMIIFLRQSQQSSFRESEDISVPTINLDRQSSACESVQENLVRPRYYKLQTRAAKEPSAKFVIVKSSPMVRLQLYYRPSHLRAWRRSMR